jgi:hypothetical protein
MKFNIREQITYHNESFGKDKVVNYELDKKSEEEIETYAKSKIAEFEANEEIAYWRINISYKYVGSYCELNYYQNQEIAID